jgi:SAM-dependent methyltransferase
MSLGSALLARLRRRLGPRGGQVANRLLYELVYSLPTVDRLAFFNGGYAPPPPDMPAAPALAVARYQAALYDLAMRVLPGPRPAPRRLLDIGCGSGGGLLHATAAFPGAALAGVDQSRIAIARARRRLAAAGVAAELHRAGGDRLPFSEGAFDRIVSIGTITYVGLEPFMREAARVLAPDGVLSVTGGVGDAPLLWMQARFARLARAEGLVLLAFEDTTEGCLAALEAQAEANAALVARLPRPLRRAGREWAVLPGSDLHAAYLAGTRKEFAAVFHRQS